MIRLVCEKIRPQAVVTTQIGGTREIPARETGRTFLMSGCACVRANPVPGQALQEALELKEDGMVFCVGSLYLIGEIKASLREEKIC